MQLGEDLSILYKVYTDAKISSNLTKARRNLKYAQQNAAQLCSEYLEEMATLLTNQQNTDISTVVKNIRHREEFRHSFQLLRPISKGTQGGAVLSILVPAELQSLLLYDDVLSSLHFASKWISVEDEDEVTARLLL
eukprot:10102224-Ditylum_brightwellii.AAC.1